MNAEAETSLPRVFPTVVHMLADTSTRFPDLTALVCGARSLSYAQYWRCVAGFAAELGGYGVRGQRVALICGNSLDIAIAMFAVHAAGAQAVPVNPTYTERELGYLLKDADPIVVICDTDIAGKIEPLATALGIGRLLRIGGDGGRLLDVWKDDLGRDLPQTLAVARRSSHAAIYRRHHRVAEGRQYQSPADGGEHQPARGGTPDAAGR